MIEAGKASRCTVWRGMFWSGVVRLARQGTVFQGIVWRGVARLALQVLEWLFLAWFGWRGTARRGRARHGRVGHGSVGSGMVRLVVELFGMVRLARHGVEWYVVASSGRLC